MLTTQYEEKEAELYRHTSIKYHTKLRQNCTLPGGTGSRWLYIICTRQLHSLDIAQSGHSLMGYYSNVIPNTKVIVPYASVSLTLLRTVLTSCHIEINIKPKKPRTYNVT